MRVAQYIGGIVIALLAGRIVAFLYLSWRDRHIPAGMLQYMRRSTYLPQILCCAVALIAIVPFSTWIPLSVHLGVVYLVAGLLIVGRDIVRPVHEQPKYARDFNIRNQKGGLVFYCLLWPLLLFMKAAGMSR